VKTWGDSASAICVEKILETIHSTTLVIVYLLYVLYFKLSCVYFGVWNDSNKPKLFSHENWGPT